jgi:uncharacterized protein DUF5684
MNSLALLAQGDAAARLGTALGLIMGCFCLFFLAVFIPFLVGLWRVFDKADQPGWAAIVPVYNSIVLLRITGYPDWLIILQLIPGAIYPLAGIAPALALVSAGIQLIGSIGSLVVWVLICTELAKRFSQGAGFAIGLIFLPFIFYPILGFGSARYRGKSGRARKKVLSDYDEDYEYEEEPRPKPRPKPKAPPPEEDSIEESADEPPSHRPSPAPASTKPAPADLVRCPECRASLRIPPGMASGKKLKCPKCSATFRTGN